MADAAVPNQPPVLARNPRRNGVPSHRRGPLPSSATAACLGDLTLPHIASFSYMVEAGLSEAVAGLHPREVTLASGDV